ncbi:RNA methyltransferase [Desulfovibrio sp.]|uniref:RNA methyltransferase n=1 Tax=Desulfovibrio sp. TaxID=885 RepID=UPI003077E6CD
MSLDLLQVVLVQTRFPENIGMAARACVNMGSHSIRLVAPERWDREKARPLATPKGQGVLDDVQVLPDVSAAVADCSLVIGTTARTGGWRRSLLSPEQAAGEVAQALERGEKVAIVFGPEDRGLDNDAIQHCQRLVTIPTNPEASSLNLAQSEKAPAEGGSGRVISSADYERLLDNLKDMLLRLDCLHGDNPDYFLMPWRRLLARAQVRRHEYDALMGLCRQVRNKLDGGNKA